MENQTVEDLKTKLDRYERSLLTLKSSDVKEVRLMHGTLAHTIVNDDIFPIVELKRHYMQAMKSRIIELKYEVLKLQQQV